MYVRKTYEDRPFVVQPRKFNVLGLRINGMRRTWNTNAQVFENFSNTCALVSQVERQLEGPDRV